MVRGRAYGNSGYIVYTRDSGPRLSPGPVRAPTYNIFQFKYNVFHIYNKAHMVAHRLGGPSQSITLAHKSQGRLWPTT